MNFFGPKKVSDVQSAQNETADILGAFTKAIDGLADVSIKAFKQAEAKTAEANALLSEASQLKNISEKNSNIAAKLQEIIS